jgi:hypothetical protein
MVDDVERHRMMKTLLVLKRYTMVSAVAFTPSEHALLKQRSLTDLEFQPPPLS